MFAVPFGQIAQILERTPEATRQLASRARHRVQGAEPVSDPDLPRQREVVDAFLAASKGNDFDALVAVLAPDVVFRSDTVAVKMGGAAELRGAEAVANTFRGRAQAARPAMVDGALALAVIFGGRLRIVLRLTIDGERITAIEAVADPQRIAGYDVALLNA
jgi:RNA polymerase sigma-70 factor (ECF subfamily)